ncbi:MAG: hypothetical protein AB1716_07360 [Planctomycetota bacterium]
MPARCLPTAASVAGLCLLLCGCATLRHENTAPYIERDIRAAQAGLGALVFDSHVAQPGRDILLLEWLGRLLRGDRAWNADTDFTQGTSFYTPRKLEELTPEALARGPCTGAPPQPPLRIVKAETGGASRGFLGKDASGRQYMVKVDDPNYPELASGASRIAGRIYWALGYNVPCEHIVTIAGTGDPRFDGRRGVATEFIADARGYFDFDWFRYRREVRALKLAAAWVNDTDRQSRNTLVTVADGRARYWLIDFNGALGCWQGWPKEPWRGHRNWGDPAWAVLTVVSFGALQPEPKHELPVVSPAVGRFHAEFAPERWQAQFRNTAFDRMTEDDGEWIAARIRQLDRPRIEAIVTAAQYSNPADAACVVETLLRRRALILDEYDDGPEP